MTNAAQRLAALDSLPAGELCDRAATVLAALVGIMNEETGLLRAGRTREATGLTAEKTRLAQDYVGLARAVQRQLPRLRREAPLSVDRLRAGHDSLATQMAENLKVIATARNVTEDLLTDVAQAVGARARASTYGANGQMTGSPAQMARGVAINRAL